MTARRLLFISYHFPPIGGAGAQRPASLARNLPDFGYAPAVVSAAGSEHDRWTPQDPSLASTIAGVEVHRVTGPDPAPSSGWPARLERWLGRRSPWTRWWIEGATRTALSIADGSEALVYTWSQPYASVDVGAELSRRLGKPWVADLGDPWALDEMNIYPTALHRRRDLARMHSLLTGAAAIVMSTPEAVARVRHAFPDFQDKPVIASPVGFDGPDFESPLPERGDGIFRIVHTGYLHTEDGLRLRGQRRLRRALRGSYLPVDMLTRSHVYLLEAVEQVVNANPALDGKIEVHLVGALSEVDREYANRSPAARTHGFMPHDETLKMMRSADLLFLPMHDIPRGERAGLVPGKTYEYLATRRPILGAVPEGDARDLLVEAGNAQVCDPPDSACMARAITSEIERWRTGLPTGKPREEVVARYERRNQAQQIAELFDSVLHR